MTAGGAMALAALFVAALTFAPVVVAVLVTGLVDLVRGRR